MVLISVLIFTLDAVQSQNIDQYLLLLDLLGAMFGPQLSKG